VVPLSLYQRALQIDFPILKALPTSGKTFSDIIEAADRQRYLSISNPGIASMKSLTTLAMRI
jgi:hypothetical protein